MFGTTYDRVDALEPARGAKFEKYYLPLDFDVFNCDTCEIWIRNF